MYRLTIGLALLGGTMALIIVGYVLFVVIDGAPGEVFVNVSRAMEPTLLAGERFTVRRILDQSSASIRRGELVTYRWPDDRSRKFVKRIAGLPGDTIAMTAGHLLVNGRVVPEPYAWLQDSTVDPVLDDSRWQRPYLAGPSARDTSRYTPSRDNWGPIVVPAKSFFVLGDNRDNSFDSRYRGFVLRGDILGEVRRVYFSRDSTGGIRWRRLGRRVQ